jgi:hypothetical protein
MENTTSWCYLQLSRRRFDSCDQLRQIVFAGFNNLTPITHVAKLGAVEALSTEMFVPLLRLVLHAYISLNHHLYFRQNMSNLNIELQYWNSFVNNSYAFLSLSSRPSTNTTCRLIPVHMGLDIFYAQTTIATSPVYEIVGAMILYVSYV